MTLTVLLEGVSGQTERGWLGWSSVILLQTGSRNILFDTGAYNDRPQIIARLGDCHVTPLEIHDVIISHLHFDHIANIDLFSNAIWHVHSNEFHATDKMGDPAPKPYRDWMLRQKNLQLHSEQRYTVHPGVEVILVAGHTLGSCAVILQMGWGKTVLLTGDSIKSRKEFEQVQTAGPDWIQHLLSQVDLIIPGHDCPLLSDGSPAKEPIWHWIETAAQMEVRHDTSV